jgi:regulator of Ty1 transposition protein 109
MAPPNATPGVKREHKVNNALVQKLASVLPKGHKFGVYHLSTPPTKTEALYPAPPNERDDKTYREDHFLAISIDAKNELGQSRPVLVFALEVFLFTTAFSTTLFVSKADSTGYLHLLDLRKGTPSPIREISAAFVSFLVEHRQRKNVQAVVSLFARSQAQYLFPGSVENKGKHVLDDRGLVKWWCRVLNPLLEPAEEKTAQDKWDAVMGYLVIPGLDDYETRAFLPRTPKARETWTLGHPLERISHYTKEFDWVPPRCLIPKYPDDPKARFCDELDEEVAQKKQGTGMWKSVRSLDQFWEMMAFRQECSSGRMTGFVWIVFDPKGSNKSAEVVRAGTPTPSWTSNGIAPATPPRRITGARKSTPQTSPSKAALQDSIPPKNQNANGGDKKKVKKEKKKLKGPVISREPRIKTQQKNYLADRPIRTAYYYWPEEGRGEKIVDESSYKRIVELLLHLDFETLEKARSSTARWTREVGIGSKWGRDITGTQEIPLSVGHGDRPAAVNSLGGGLIKRKQPHDNATADAGEVNVLSAGLVRKKAKVDDAGAERQETRKTAMGGETSAVPAVNVLGAGLVRKKPKV